MTVIKVGVVSTRSHMCFDRLMAKRRIAQAYDEALAHFAPRGVKRLTIVLRSTEGVLATAHQEARKRGWDIETLPHMDHPAPPFSANELSIAGRDWGKHGSSFVSAVDGIIEMGRDNVSHQETLEAAEQHKPVFVYQLLMLSMQPEPA